MTLGYRGSAGAAPAQVAVVGAGAWGTALANLLAESGNRVRLWAREPEVVESFADRGENALYLEGARLDREQLSVTNSLPNALRGAEFAAYRG